MKTRSSVVERCHHLAEAGGSIPTRVYQTDQSSITEIPKTMFIRRPSFSHQCVRIADVS